MSLKRRRQSDHYLTARRDVRSGIVTWNGVSEWDAPYSTRLRTVMHRSTWITDRAVAKRWAKKYGVEFPPDPPENPAP